jgi:CRISPR-associated protein Cas1
MKKDLYIFPDSLLKKGSDTIEVQKLPPAEGTELRYDKEAEYLDFEDIDVPSSEKQFHPIEAVGSIFTFGASRFNTMFLGMMAREHIPVHVYNFYDDYTGSFFPRKEHSSGGLLLCQSEAYHDHSRRMYLAKKFISGGLVNMNANLKYYAAREVEGLEGAIALLEEGANDVSGAATIDELMGIEGNLRRFYYSVWNCILTNGFELNGRIKQPPPDPINSLISYGNMIVYNAVQNQTYTTRLYPEIGYLHQPGDNSFPLCYDVAEIFKPVITDRIIFRMVNKGMITPDDFDLKEGKCLIKDKAKKVFISQLDERLQTVIKHRQSKKSMSYKTTIKHELHKIIKFLENGEEYKPFRMLW